jgi:hypothetical protein
MKNQPVAELEESNLRIFNLRGRYSALKGPRIAKPSGRIAKNLGAPVGGFAGFFCEMSCSRKQLCI